MRFNWATYRSATGCTKYGPAGCRALLTYLEDRFPDQVSMGICNCRSVRGGSSYSHHAECRAYDEGFAVFVGQTIGIKTLELVGPHGASIGCDHMSMTHQPGASDRGDPRIYSARSPQGRVYTGAHAHKNHNHIGLTRNSGLHLTYATLVSVLGPAIPEEEGDDDRLLQKGSKGQNVAELQKIMAERFNQQNGSWTPWAGKSVFDGQPFQAGEDGGFGPTCDTNVKNVQGILGQAKTGVVDQLLWDALVHHRYGSGGDHPDKDHSTLATSAELKTEQRRIDNHTADAKTSTPHS